MRKELGTDDAAKEEIHGDRQADDSGTDREIAVVDSPRDPIPVTSNEKLHYRVFPLLRAFPEQEGRQDGGDQHREDQSTQQGEGDGPGHWPEEPPFDGLQREDGQIGRDDDENRVKRPVARSEEHTPEL